jgi:hypothetical protein
LRNTQSSAAFGQEPANRRKASKAILSRREDTDASVRQRQENEMRRLLICSFVSLAWAAPALAQDAPQGETTPPNTAQEQDEELKQAVQSIERSVHTQLALEGFTQIQMIPTSFLIRAKDRDGNPVMLMLSPDSVGKLNKAVPDEPNAPDDESDSDMPLFQPLRSIPATTGAK